MNRSNIALFGTLICSGLSGLTGCGGEEQKAAAPVDVRVFQVTRQDVPITREWVGQTYGAVDIEIRARVAGWLQGIHFREGTEVAQGALLYSIDPTEIEQDVAAARARLAESRTLYARAESDVKRYRPLAASGAVSQRDLETAEAEYGARRGDVEAREAELRLTEVNLGYTKVSAPLNGLIGISAARVGDFVGRAPNPVILNTISQVDSVHVKFSITEVEYLDVVRRLRARGGAVEDRAPLKMILADGSVYPHDGVVSFVQRQVDATTGTLQLEASFPNPDRLLRPGQFARINTIVDRRSNALVVPSRAVSELQGQSLVWVVGGENKAEMRRVRLGPQSGVFTLIEEGVNDGERVVVEGFQRLRPGTPLTVSDVNPDSLLPAAGR